MMKSFAIIIGLLTLLFTDCTKRTIVEPTACLKSDKSRLKRYETITFFNCTPSIFNSSLKVTRRGEEWTGPQIGYLELDSLNNYTSSFSDTGNFTAVLDAFGGDGSTVDSALIYIRVD